MSAGDAAAVDPWLILPLLALPFLWALPRLARTPRLPPAAPPPRVERLALGLVVLIGVAVRAVALSGLPPHRYEARNLLNALQIPDVLLAGPAAVTAPGEIFHLLHPPLYGIISFVWGWLGGALGLGGSLAWLRLASLGASALLLVSIARAGRHLGAPWAGLAAAVTLALLPALRLPTTFAMNYAWELACAAWFLERLLCAFSGRPVVRSLSAAALLALYAGNLNALLVGLGLGAYAWWSVRRGRGRAALVMALFIGLSYAPQALRSATGFRIARALSQETVQADELSRFEGGAAAALHDPLERDDSLGESLLVALPFVLLWRLTGAQALLMGLSVLAFAGLATRRPGAAVATLALSGLFSLAGLLIGLHQLNVLPILPAFLLALPSGAERGAPGWLRARLGRPAAPLVLAVALIVGGLTAPDRGPDADPELRSDLPALVAQARAQRGSARAFVAADFDWAAFVLCEGSASLGALGGCARAFNRAYDDGPAGTLATVGDETLIALRPRARLEARLPAARPLLVGVERRVASILTEPWPEGCSRQSAADAPLVLTCR
jgi:hypothetical protein